MTIRQTHAQLAELLPIPKLDTHRLHLRGWLPTDVDAWRRICGGPETMRYIGDGTVIATGRRLTTEAAPAAARWANQTLGAASLISLIHPENTASVRVAHKLDAQFEVRVELDVAAADQYRLPLDQTERAA